jgi:hypothetical protein
MHQEYSANKYETLLKEKLQEQMELHPDDSFTRQTNIDHINPIETKGAELILEQLH